MLILTVVLCLLFYALYKRQQHMNFFKRLRIPGPKPNFIFGNSIELKNEGSWGTFPKWTEKYGPIVGFFIGGLPQILTTDFELMRRVFVRDFHIFTNKSQLIPGGIHPVPEMQKALVWTRDNTWRHFRASLSPSFSPHKLNGMEPLMMSSIDKLIIELHDKAKSGKEFNLKSSMTELTFSAGTKCIFGLDSSLRKLDETSKNFLEAADPRLEKSILAMIMIFFPSLTCIAWPLRLCWERLRFYMLWSGEGAYYDFMKNIVKVRRDLGTKSVDFLQLLMNTKRVQATTDEDLEMSDGIKQTDTKQMSSNDALNENISEEEILSTSIIFLLGSYDSTSNTLQFCLHNLITHPDIQEELRNELRKVVPSGSDHFSSSLIAKVPLLNHIIKETLRMFPPISPFVTRVAKEDYKYEDIVIPKRTTVHVGVSSIHNDPKHWPEPEKFRPKRFESDYDAMSYLPFGAGPRNCIGMKFAYMEIQLAIANMILKYRFEPGPSTEKKVETSETFASLVPKNGVFCKVTKL